MVYNDILSRDDVPHDVKRYITGLEGQLETYRSLIAHIPAVTWMTDNKGKTTFISPNVEKVYGYTPEEIYRAGDRLWFERIHHDDVEHVKEAFQSLFTRDQEFNIEYRIQKKDGNWIWIHDKALTTYEKEGVIYAYGVFSDITERKQTEKALQESEQKWRTLVENAPDIIFTVDYNGKILFINHPPAGLSTEDAIGTSVYDYVALKYRKMVKQSIQKVYQTEEPDRFEIAARGPYDETSWYMTHLGSIKHNDKVQAVLLITRDITERKKMEKALEESERKLQTIMDAIQTGIVIIDAQSHRIVDANPMAISMIGATKDEIINSVCHEIICPTEQGQCPICDLGQKIDRSERLLQNANGELIPILKTANIMILDEKEYIIESFLDITERKQNEEIMKAQRDLSVALSTTTDLEETLELIIDTVLKIKEIDSGGIYLVSKESGDLFLAQYKGFTEEFIQHVSFIKADDPRVKIVMKGKPIYGAHQQVVPSASKSRLKEGLVALGVIPVLFEGKVIAALNVASHSVEEIPNHSRNILEAISTQIGSILELMEIQEALRASREHYQMLVEKLEEGVVLEDAAGYLIFANPKAAQMLGWKVEEVLGRHWSQLIPESQVELVSKEFSKRSKGISSSYEVNLQKKDGSPIPVIVAATPVITPEGEFDGTIAVLTNIAEMKHAEEEIRKERDLAQKYLDTAGVMMLAIEANQQVSLINRKGCEILGYEEEEVLGKNWFDSFIPPRLRREVKEGFTKLMIRDVELIEYGEYPIITRDGTEKIIGWHNTILKNKDGEITGILSSGEDISERIEADRIRKELEERRENFIYMTTHELRTPLTVIGGYCDFLSEHDEFIDHPRREKIYHILRSNVNRLERLTQDVSHIVQLERGEFLIEKEEIKICPFLNLILEPYDHLLGSQFSFQACSEEQPVIIQADSDRLQQVMENVISNAIKHTPKDRREIIVSTEILADKVRILIKDNGAGIASEHLETIFEQFITIPTDYTATGTGIGLYLSREIIKAHDGTITAQSKGKGEGSTFIIELPRKLD